MLRLIPSKKTSYRLAHCGNFPHYQLDNYPLNSTDIIYLVSVGKEKFEEKWVKRFVNFIEEVKQKNSFIVVADSLQRFNLEVDENLSKEEALQEARLRGETWIEKYKPYFSKLKQPYEFIRWEALTSSADYDSFYFDVIQMSKSDDEFEKALLNSSEQYTKRPSRLESNQSLALKNSNDFLKEECAVLRVLAKEKNTKAILYPGKATEVLSYAIQKINDLDRSDNPIHWMELKPTKDKKLKKGKKLKFEIKNESENYLYLKPATFFGSSSSSLASKNESSLREQPSQTHAL